MSVPVPPPSSDSSEGVAAWGLLIGAALGAGLGVWLGHWLAGATGLAAVGWVVGAFIDRSRR